MVLEETQSIKPVYKWKHATRWAETKREREGIGREVGFYFNGGFCGFQISAM